ncbi:YicC/YloC family endoribonuclease [Hyphomicrobium sp. LHD-15]|uniref:YicC/YloC family endoribonuclease n=1 Tax=Hyphomicrobium sp. LHD-15 TaxID=3072142 RepID=UPI00280F8C27|nr:YicC/YloC family endoribonuclease [Hyphomicrobium sp. LHD-15]MDQ8700347.1 YicC/YloC family endoribonuclease [Hyphomicrobium sp. LHD-15]
MTLQSMTGFARSDGAIDGATWHWEIKSVNNRGLDIRLRLPTGYEAVEPKIRDRIAKLMSRGSINANLSVARRAQVSDVRINQAVLDRVLELATRLSHNTGAEKPRVETLLGLKGVLDVVEEADDEETLAREQASVIQGFESAITGLVTARREEGARLKQVVSRQIDEIARLANVVEASPSRSVEAIRRRLAEQVARLVETGQGLDPVRLHQEAVLIATRADVEEELKRLAAHVEAARALLREEGAIGRKLDFLAQEFNREANTLTSKAGDQEIAHAGLALKVVIDQLREQVQNIE